MRFFSRENCKGLKCKHSVNIADAWTTQQIEIQEKENEHGQNIQKGLCLERTICHPQLNILYLLDFATFPRSLQQGRDQRKGQRCPRSQRRAVKPAVIRRETLTSAVCASRLRAGGDAPRLQSLQDERAKKTRTGTAAGGTTAWTNSSR